MTVGIKEMIARCIQRMRAKECARCDNRAVCPASRWQSMFAEFEQPREERAHDPFAQGHAASTRAVVAGEDTG